jgi:hypothetical protein
LSQRLTAKGRPEQFSWWTKRARNLSNTPQILDISSFSTQYISWWGTIATKGSYIGGPNGFFVAMMLLRWWGVAFEARKTGEAEMDMSDALWREERNIWHEYVDNARQSLAFLLGRPYTRISPSIHKPVVPLGGSRKRTRSSVDDESASARGMLVLSPIPLSCTNLLQSLVGLVATSLLLRIVRSFVVLLISVSFVVVVRCVMSASPCCITNIGVLSSPLSRVLPVDSHHLLHVLCILVTICTHDFVFTT